MASTITLKHYSDTNNTADSPTLSMDVANVNGRVIGATHPKSIGWSGIFHSIEVEVTVDTDLVGCEFLAIGMFVKDIRQNLI